MGPVAPDHPARGVDGWHGSGLRGWRLALGEACGCGLRGDRLGRGGRGGECHGGGGTTSLGGATGRGGRLGCGEFGGGDPGSRGLRRRGLRRERLGRGGLGRGGLGRGGLGRRLIRRGRRGRGGLGRGGHRLRGGGLGGRRDGLRRGRPGRGRSRLRGGSLGRGRGRPHGGLDRRGGGRRDGRLRRGGRRLGGGLQRDGTRLGCRLRGRSLRDSGLQGRGLHGNRFHGWLGLLRRGLRGRLGERRLRRGAAPGLDHLLRLRRRAGRLSWGLPWRLRRRGARAGTLAAGLCLHSGRTSCGRTNPHGLGAITTPDDRNQDIPATESLSGSLPMPKFRIWFRRRPHARSGRLCHQTETIAVKRPGVIIHPVTGAGRALTGVRLPRICAPG